MSLIYQLISKANLPIIPAKKSRKNKHRQFYTWTLERFINTPRNVPAFDIDYFPSSSEQFGIQLIKVAFKKAMNQANLFDFEFTPKERDYLTIKSDDNRDVYLNLIYLDNNWKEEQYSGTLRDLQSDKYILYTEGKIELK